ncbi:hypothetical protein BH10ACT2_BH10ACT2_06810 [soil metagenome]
MNQPEISHNKFSRRGLLRIGGLTTASVAAIAACGQTQAGTPGNIGVGEGTPKLDDPIVNNGVLMRTLAGIELSIAAAYQRMIDSDLLSVASSTFPDVGDLTTLVAEYGQHHIASAKTLNDLAVDAGEERWECGNTRLDTAYINVVFDRVLNGAAATDAAPAIEPSEDPTRDMLNLVYTLETLTAAACQDVVPQVSEPAMRAAATAVGVKSARKSALMALLLNPGGYVSNTDATNARPDEVTTTAAPTTTQNIAAPAAGGASGGAEETPLTEIPLPVAIPSQFGSLAPIVWVGGAGDENGVRLRLNFETPSFNSFAYPFDSCAAAG